MTPTPEPMRLYIGNKNYSSWSMRPWVLMREFGLPFEEVMIRFDDMGPDSRFKREVMQVSPAGRVPVLAWPGRQLVVWDSLAIAEALADAWPQHPLWPADPATRARARSACCEMHSGFGAMRATFPMNIEASLPEVGARMLRERPEARADLDRIVALWTDALQRHGGPFLFGAYSIADAYFAPVVARIRSYALPLPPTAARYAEAVWATRGVQAWVQDALAEACFVPVDEPYRSAR